MRKVELERLGLCAAARLRIAKAEAATVRADRQDAEIMRLRSAALARGATSAEIERNVLRLWGEEAPEPYVVKGRPERHATLAAARMEAGRLQYLGYPYSLQILQGGRVVDLKRA